MYELSEQDYQTVVAGLVDAVLNGVQSLRDAGLDEQAQRLATQGQEALQIYDDDVAELVGRAATSDMSPERIGKAREVDLW